MRRILMACVSALFLVVLAAPVRAAPIVINSGFDSGDFTGWTVERAPFGSLIHVVGPPYEVEFAGTAFPGPGFGDKLWQQLDTSAGESYLVTFSLRHNNEGCGTTLSGNNCLVNYFLVDWGATQPFLIFSRPSFESTPFSFTATASGASTRLLFEGGDDPGAYRLDAVSVTTVPEPATLLLMATGILASAGRRFRAR